jgi:hypothetical protein
LKIKKYAFDKEDYSTNKRIKEISLFNQVYYYPGNALNKDDFIAVNIKQAHRVNKQN